MSQAKCWRCKKRMDQSFFDPGYKACKECREQTKQYLLSNAASIREKQKLYYEAHKQDIKQYQQDNEEHIKANKAEKKLSSMQLRGFTKWIKHSPTN